MKICFLTDTFLPKVGGAEMVLDNLATRMTGRGATVVVVAPKCRGACDDAAFPYRVYRFHKPVSKRFGVRLLLPRLAALHLKYRFDVIHCHSGYPASYVAAAFQRLFGVPFVVRPHGTDILPGRRIRNHPRVEGRLRQALASADAVVAQGRFLRSVILELGIDERRIHTIHNGVDLAAFRESSRHTPCAVRSDVRAHATLPLPTGESATATGSSPRNSPHPCPSPKGRGVLASPLEFSSRPRPYILSVGTLKHLKGFDILLRAYARLDHPRADLLIAGAGPEEQALLRLARELGIAERVRFVGFVEGRPKVELYRSAEFFVCPSRIESFANVILEALAAGLPIVASDVGGNSELVHDDRHGLLFPSEDAAALAAALNRLLDDAALLARFRQAVPEFIGGFDWPLVVDRYLALYQAVIERRRADFRRNAA